MASTYIIIPARYQSSRLPGKMLLPIAGKPLIQHVYERALETKFNNNIIVATDDMQIKQAVEKFGGKICMTATTHASGTERIAEVIDKFFIADEDYVINIQGDEPLINPRVIEQLDFSLRSRPAISMATLAEEITSLDELWNPCVTKVIRDQNGFAIYFSHAPIPFYRDGFLKSTKEFPADFIYYRHIGIYAYCARFVKQYIAWQASPLERIESLEQLRVLWHGEKIYVDVAQDRSGPGIDTIQEYERVKKQIESKRPLHNFT